jgi:hypothetical protein
MRWKRVRADAGVFFGARDVCLPAVIAPMHETFQSQNERTGRGAGKGTIKLATKMHKKHKAITQFCAFCASLWLLKPNHLSHTKAQRNES